MAFSNEWDEQYKNNHHMSIWPWSDLVSSIYRYANPKNGYKKVLELGCGAGANIPLFLSLNFDYYGIEGSQSISKRVIDYYPQLSGKIITSDFTKEHLSQFNDTVDIVVDRASITHNDTLSIEKILMSVFLYLKPGGKFIGIDWFSTKHDDFYRGICVDTYTKKDLPANSQFSGVGQVHFSDKNHILELFYNAGLTIERLEHKERNIEIPTNQCHFASWDIIAVKPN